MEITIEEVRQTVELLHENEFAYRVLYDNLYYFVYHTRSSIGRQRITIAVPLKPNSNFLLFDNHLAERELTEKLREQKSQ